MNLKNMKIDLSIAFNDKRFKVYNANNTDNKIGRAHV